MLKRSCRNFLFTLGLASLLTACGSWSKGEQDYPDSRKEMHKYGRITGEKGIVLFGGEKKDATGAAIGLGVNSFLWRASLDTISFMPLQSADPFGGVIITDWYAAPESPNERFKVIVYILGKELRADGIRVSAFRQEKTAGGWVDAQVEPKTATELENAILFRARELRVQATN